MIAIFKVILTLTLVVILLHRKAGMGLAMLAGTVLLFVLSSPQWSTLEAVGRNLLFSSSTWEIVVALYLVMCLEFQLRTSGIIDGLMAASRNLLKSDKALLVLMPAFLGFLPSLGGAIFSAPLVEAAGKPYGLSPEKKTAINYWFRHVWECTNPILPALLLASQIAQVPLNSLIANMLWVSVLCLLFGWFLFIAPLKIPVKSQAAITAGAYGSSGSYRYLLLSAGPIVANFLLVVGLNLGPATSMLLVVITMMLVLRMRPGDIAAMLRHAFDRKLLWGVLGILLFQHMLRQTGVMDEVASVLQSTGIPIMIVIGVVGFLAGLLTGTSQGVVAITFPLVAAVSTGNVAACVVAYVAGTAGQMLSPAHLCLLVTLDYYKADFLKSLRAVAVLEIFMLLALSVKTTI